MSENNKENDSNLSFLVNSLENDTIFSDTSKDKNLNEQFSENTVGLFELKENAVNEDLHQLKKISSDDDFIINNSLDFLVEYYKMNESLFLDIFHKLSIDENKEKFEKLANIAILIKFNLSKLIDLTKIMDINTRYASTFVSIFLLIYEIKIGKTVNLDLILKRARDKDQRIRKIVINEIFNFYDISKDEIRNQLFLSLRDPNKSIQEKALEGIQKICLDESNNENFLLNLESIIREQLSGQIQRTAADFLFDIFEKNKNEEKKLSILKICSFSKIEILINQLKKKEKDIFIVYHILYEKCTIQVFDSFEFTHAQKNKYCTFIINSFKNSKKCCVKENCHLKILSAINFKNLKLIFELLEITKENSKNISIIIELLSKIETKRLANSEYTESILKIIASNKKNHTENFIILLQRLEEKMQSIILEIIKTIKHKKLIGYFNIEPSDNFGILCKALWHLRDKKFDEIKKIEFFDYKNEDIQEISKILLYLINRYEKIKNKNLIDNSKEFVEAIKIICDKSIEFLSLNMAKIKKNDIFYDFLITFLLKGYFQSHKSLLFKSFSNLKQFIKKSQDMDLIINIVIEFLLKNNKSSNIKEISTIFIKKMKNRPSIQIFNILKGLILEKKEMKNFKFLIPILSLDERIILENIAEGEFKQELKSKCTN